MLRKYGHLIAPLCRSALSQRTAPKNGLFKTDAWNSEPLKRLHLGSKGILGPICSRNFHWSLPRNGRDDRREMLASLPPKDEGTEGERTVDIDSLVQSETSVIPNARTFTTLFDGIPFKDIPILNVSVTKNNTVFSLTTAAGQVLFMNSCGREGFKNARKGTNVAAQATAISIGTKSLERGHKTVRVRVRGLGPGRMSAIKGLEMAGLNIVSVTDSTRVSWNPPRARKQRKL